LEGCSESQPESTIANEDDEGEGVAENEFGCPAEEHENTAEEVVDTTSLRSVLIDGE